MNAFLFFALVATVSGSDIDSRVIGGSNANIANHPYQASLRINGGHNCGAVLISNTRALTAAHCGGGPVSGYSILAGTTDRTATVCASCALRNPILQFIRHANFSNNPVIGYPNDIAIATFYSIAANANIKYATLASDKDEDFAGQSCVISGWGRQTVGGALPEVLQDGTLTVLTYEECGEQWNFNRISRDHLCARDTTRAACGGDNGGPLVCDGLVAGIFSWGEANCSPTYASVFARVSSYAEWINSNLLAEDEDDGTPINIDEAIKQGWGWN